MIDARVGVRVARSLIGRAPHFFNTPQRSPHVHVQARTASSSRIARPSKTMSSTETPGTRALPAIFARGGTSNGLVLHERDLPSDRASWRGVLAPSMGSPDPVHGRQLDGMGGGISSTSKVCVIAPRAKDEGAAQGVDADVDFTFVQVGVRDGSLDLGGNCGNMLSIVGPAALDEGVIRAGAEGGGVKVEVDEDGGWATVKIYNTNTKKVIHSRFRVRRTTTSPDDSGHWIYDPSGSYAMDGVPGTGSRITLSFIDPAGAGTGRGALPTGNPIEVLEMSDESPPVEASLVDVGNPGVFVRASDVLPDAEGKDNLFETFTPTIVDADASLKERLALIRRAGAEKMGLDPSVESVPKIVLVFPPPPSSEGSGEALNLRCLALSMGQAHKAVPLTLALCLGAASRIEGTIPARLTPRDPGAKCGGGGDDVVSIGHPSGRVEISTALRGDGSITSAALHRTARVLMKGLVFY